MAKLIQRFNPFTGVVDQCPAYGDQFVDFYDPTVSITTSTTFQDKLVIATPILKPGAVYYIDVSYGWNHDSGNNDLEARLFDLDAALALDYLDGWHKQEPKDSAGNWEGTGSAQRMYISRRYRVTGAGTIRNLAFQYRTDTGGAESSVWELLIEVKRVS